MEGNYHFKNPFSVLSVVTITVAAILLTVFVMNHEGTKGFTETLFLFALIFLGPLSLLFFVVNDPGAISIEAFVLLTVTPSLLVAATFWRSKQAVILKRLGWFLWVLCSLVMAGTFI